MKLSKELKIGIFVITIFVISFFVINYLRGKDILNREVEYFSEYENVQGLVASAPVFVNGYKAGKVSEISYIPEKKVFKVVCSVGKDFLVPEDSKMTIYSVDIMGSKGVRLDEGVSESLASDGSYLAPDTASDLIAGLAENMGPLLSKVGETLDSLNVTVSSVNKVLSADNRARLDRTLLHLEHTMSDLSDIAEVVGGRSRELDEFILNLADLSESMKGVAVKADTLVTDLSSVAGKLNQSDIQGLVESFRSLLTKIEDPEGTVGKLLTDGSVYDSVDSLLRDVDSLVNKIQDNPKKYIKFTIF